MLKKDNFDEVIEALRDPKVQEELLEIIDSSRTEIYSLLSFAKDACGEDIEKFFDFLRANVVSETTKYFKAYIEMGFSRDEAITLVTSIKQNISNNARRL